MLADNDRLMKLGAGEATQPVHRCEPALRWTFQYVPHSKTGVYSGVIVALGASFLCRTDAFDGGRQYGC